MDITQFVCSKLGLNQQQAEAGLGILFRFAKEQLPQTDFAKLAQFIPNVGALSAAAPAAPAASAAGVGGMLGSALSALGGSAGSLGTMAKLAGQFTSAGLDATKLQSFGQTIGAFLMEKGAGDDLKQIIARLLAK